MIVFVFVAVCATEAVELTQAQLRRSFPKSFQADFLCCVFLSLIL